MKKNSIPITDYKEIFPNYLRRLGRSAGAKGLEYYYKLLIKYNIHTAKREFDYVADPFKLIYVDPHEIEYATFQFDRRKDTGKVVPGKWDISGEPKTVFEDFQRGSLRRYDGYYDHFMNGIPWEETTFYEQAVERIEQGERVVSRESVSDLDTYLDKIDAIYNDMAEKGYKSIYELTGSEHAASGDLRSLLDDIVVVITRDGTIWRAAGGRHRHILARFLDLDKIAVRVAVRHYKWQQTREVYFKRENQTPTEDPRTHPDLVDTKTTVFRSEKRRQ